MLKVIFNVFIFCFCSIGWADWGDFIEISKCGQRAFNEQVAIDDEGRGVCIWTVVKSGKSVVQASVFTDDRWSYPVDLSLLDWNADQSKVVMDSAGNATIIWRSSNEVRSIIKLRSFSFRDGWSSIVNISKQEDRSISPQIAVGSEGTVDVVWVSEVEDSFVVQTRDISIEGQLGEIIDVSDYGFNFFAPQIAVDSNKKAIVWFGGKSRREGLQAAIYSNGIWENNTKLKCDSNRVSNPAIFPRVIIDNNESFFSFWKEDYIINFQKFSLNGFSSFDSIYMGGDRSNSNSFDVVLDEFGDMVVAWIQKKANNSYVLVKKKSMKFY
jgi:hypothetical protein